MQRWMSLWAGLALAVASLCAHADLLIGQTAGFSGIVAASVQETTAGARLYLDHVNARGGVLGQKITLISLDDKFDPKLAAENARQLIEEKNVLALFLTRGTPHNEAILPLLEKYGVPLIAPSTGAMVFHQPVNKHVFNVRSSYQREAEKAVMHLATIGVQRIAVLYVNDSFGADALAGAQKGMTAAKLDPVVLAKFDRAKPDFAPLVQQVSKADAQSVLVLGSGKAVADAVQALRAAGSAAQVVTLSNNASSGFVKSLGENARGVVITQVFPSERSIAYAIVKEAQTLLKAQNKSAAELSPIMLEGFAAAKVLVEGLQRAGPQPTREKLRTALESIRKFDLGGMELSYAPDDHTGLVFTDLSIVGPDGKFLR